MLANLSENNENVDKQNMCIGTDILKFIIANSLCILHYAQRNHANSFNLQTITFNFTYIYVNCRVYISPADAGVHSPFPDLSNLILIDRSMQLIISNTGHIAISNMNRPPCWQWTPRSRWPKVRSSRPRWRRRLLARFLNFLEFRTNSSICPKSSRYPESGFLTSPECSFTHCDVDGLPWPRDADKIGMQ